MKHKKMQYTYVGIDSHKAEHTAVFLDCFHEKLGEITFENLPSKFVDFLIEAETIKAEGTSLIFGMEDVSAYGRTLMVFLTDNSQRVKHVNAILVAQERKSQSHRQKTDSIDAECAAKILLRELDSLPDAEPDDKYWNLRTLVVRRQFIVKNNTSLKNHLHCLITTHYPNYQQFFYNIDCNSSLAFLEKYPSPSTLTYTTADDLSALLSKASDGHVGIEKAQEILETVKNNGDSTTQFQEIRNITIQSTIRQFRFNMEELKQIDKSLAEFLSEFNCTLMSMNGIDFVTAAQLLSCIGDIRKFSSSAKLARYSGIAPISYSSGKKDLRFANEMGNRELNSLFYKLAVRVSMTVGSTNKAINPFFYDYYNKKLSEGKTKRQSIKCVQRRLVNIIWRMLTDNEEYINPPMIEIPREEDENVK